jgi:serine/threonine protein phosphatase PrpC
MVRKVNEDSCLERSDLGLWAVADGMGGHAAGDVASRMVVEALARVQPPGSCEALVVAVENRLREVNQRLRAASASTYQDRVVGSTVAVLGVFANVAVCLWAGDSRIYHFKDGALRRLTRDHSHVQSLVDQGLIGEHEAERHPMANVITRAVGASDSLEIDHVEVTLDGSDRFLLCSDGLTRLVDDPEIEQTLTRAGDREAVQALTHLALVRGAPDNVTSVLVSTHPAPGPRG